MKTLTLLLLVLAVIGCLDDFTVTVELDDTALTRQQCFQGQFELCQCENPTNQAEANFCEEHNL